MHENRKLLPIFSRSGDAELLRRIRLIRSVGRWQNYFTAFRMCHRNLTEPTRLCGALGIFNNLTAMNCLGSLGFSLQCGSIWWWNIINTREECTWVRTLDSGRTVII